MIDGRSAEDILEEELAERGLDSNEISQVFDAIDDLGWREPITPLGANLIQAIRANGPGLSRIEIDIPRQDIPTDVFRKKYQLVRIED